jgi:hypothetical protein
MDLRAPPGAAASKRLVLHRPRPFVEQRRQVEGRDQLDTRTTLVDDRGRCVDVAGTAIRPR